MTLTSRRLLSQFRWELCSSEHPEPVRAQIGGVAAFGRALPRPLQAALSAVCPVTSTRKQRMRHGC